MNDRFKFRGVLTVEYGGENADDKTVDLIIEKADAIHGGDIGFDIDQLDAAIEKAGITDDIEIDQIHEFCYDNNGCRSDEYFVMDGDIKQCTGLKDKNGNLIYEGDCVGFYVYEQDGEWYGGQGTVVLHNSSWGIETSSHFIRFENNIPMANPQGVEIIGNIPEQAEQKE